MAWIDYNKTFNFVSPSWINGRMGLFGIADNVTNFLEKSVKQWKLSLMSHGEDLVDVEVRREIFRGDCHSPHLFF